MGNVSFWTCTVILLCAGGITYCHRFSHEGSSNRYRNYDQKLSYFGSKGGYSNAPPYQTFEPDYVQPVPPSGPPLRSYARDIPPYDYQNSRLPPPEPSGLPCSEYEEDEYPYSSDEHCPCCSGGRDCDENCPCECPCCCGNCEPEDYPCPCERGSDCPCCCERGGECSCERCSCCGRCDPDDYPSNGCPCCGRCDCPDEPDYPEEPLPPPNSRIPQSYSEYYPIPEKRGRNSMEMRYGNDRYSNSDSYSCPAIRLPPPPPPVMPPPPPPPPPPPMMPPPPPPPAPIPPPPPPAPIPSYQYPPQYPPEDSYRNRQQMIVTVSKTYGSPGQIPPGPEQERMMSNPHITEQTSYSYQMPRQPEIPQPRLTQWRPPPPPPRRVMPEDPYPEPSYGRRSYQGYSRNPLPPVGDGRSKPYLDGLSYPDGC